MSTSIIGSVLIVGVLRIIAVRCVGESSISLLRSGRSGSSSIGMDLLYDYYYLLMTI